MNENDLFNKDSMFWREVNATLPYGLAEIELYEPELVKGERKSIINCNLLPFEDEKVEYEMENGGSFMKTEVKSWPLVLLTDLEFYTDESNSQADRDAKVLRLPHVQVKSIIIKDNKGVVLCKKTKL